MNEVLGETRLKLDFVVKASVMMTMSNSVMYRPDQSEGGVADAWKFVDKERLERVRAAISDEKKILESLCDDVSELMGQVTEVWRCLQSLEMKTPN